MLKIEAETQIKLDGSTYAEVSLVTNEGKAVIWSTRHPSDDPESLKKTSIALGNYLENHIRHNLGIKVSPRAFRAVEHCEEILGFKEDE